MSKLPSIDELAQAVTAAGNYAKKHFGHKIDTRTKADGTLVTQVDREINTYFLFWSEEYDDLGYIAEEGNGRTDKEYILYVDPLDGTDAYARGMATANIIATIIHIVGTRGTPVATVIYNFMTGEVWSAVTKRGASKWSPREDLTVVPPEGKIKTAVCAWPGSSHNLEHVSRQISQAYLEGFSDQQMGAFGIGGGLIAQGTLHATACGQGSATETAAMMLLVTEAGGIAIDLNSEPITDFELGEWKGKTDFLLPNGAIIASDMATAEKLLEFINKHQDK